MMTTAHPLATVVPFPRRDGDRLPSPPIPAKRPKKKTKKAGGKAVKREEAAIRRRVEREMQEENARAAWRDLFYEAIDMWPDTPQEAVLMLIAGSTFPVKRSTFWAVGERAFPDADQLIISRHVDRILAAMVAAGEIVCVSDRKDWADIVTVPARPVGRRLSGTFKYVDAWPQETEGVP